MSAEDWKIVTDPLGFRRVEPKPSKEKLSEYYADKYFQEGLGGYEVNYTDREIAHNRLKASLIVRQVERILPHRGDRRLLDIGCGEGWLMHRFLDAGYGVKGVDFSSHGIKKWHPDLETNLMVGDYELVLRDELRRGERYDVVTIANVIEHVLDPRTLVGIARTLLTQGGVLVVVAPNDFSPLQELLLQEGIIDEPFWIAYPDHLSYFNKETMVAFLSDAGMNVRAIVADNPVDLNLLNEQTNYVREPKKGKSVHRFRVAVDLFLAGVDLDGLLNVYEALGAMGVGRDLTYYCVPVDGEPAR